MQESATPQRPTRHLQSSEARIRHALSRELHGASMRAASLECADADRSSAPQSRSIENSGRECWRSRTKRAWRSSCCDRGLSDRAPEAAATHLRGSAHGLRIPIRPSGRRLVIVEIKSIEKLERVHLAQLLSYLRFARCQVGLLDQLQRRMACRETASSESLMAFREYGLTSACSACSALYVVSVRHVIRPILKYGDSVLHEPARRSTRSRRTSSGSSTT